MEYLLQCENLVKKYGRKKTLNDLNLKIEKGKNEMEKCHVNVKVYLPV